MTPRTASAAAERAGLPGKLRSRLLDWYDANRRDLPWRARDGETPDPYRVWLSEVMLQQTRVETVVAYYRPWLERFPTLEALAAAPLDEVLKAWEGLGYYSRARNFHRAVRQVRERCGGQVPREPEAFRELPGVGRYTAGAVMSIAFGRPEPVVDGNVRRVFARLTDEAVPADAALWRLATDLVAGERPGDFNQALMELGATLCTPRSPRCGECPVSSCCAAFAAGSQARRPARRPSRPLPLEDTAVAVVRHQGRLLLVRRRLDTRLGGLWEFPGTVRRRGQSVADAAERGVRYGLGLTIRAGEPLGDVSHVFSHLRATYRAVNCTLSGGEPRAIAWDAWAWLDPRELVDYALPAAQRRIAALAAGPASSRSA